MLQQLSENQEFSKTQPRTLQYVLGTQLSKKARSTPFDCSKAEHEAVSGLIAAGFGILYDVRLVTGHRRRRIDKQTRSLLDRELR